MHRAAQYAGVRSRIVKAPKLVICMLVRSSLSDTSIDLQTEWQNALLSQPSELGAVAQGFCSLVNGTECGRERFKI